MTQHTYYGIDDEHSQAYAQGVPEWAVWDRAQEIADRVGRPVYVYDMADQDRPAAQVDPSEWEQS